MLRCKHTSTDEQREINHINGRIEKKKCNILAVKNRHQFNYVEKQSQISLDSKSKT